MHFVEKEDILSTKNTMDVYQGCTNGCIYCNLRGKSKQINHPLEDVEVNSKAPEALETLLRQKTKRAMIGMGVMGDPYTHCEEKLRLTRQCLEIIDEYSFGATIHTKSDMVLRDLDLLRSIHRKSKCVVTMSMSTYDEELCKIVEPDVCTTKRRFEVLDVLREYGIPTIVWLNPIIPMFNDTKENMEGLLDYCVRAKIHGAFFLHGSVNLEDGSREYFYKGLEQKMPEFKETFHRKYGYANEIVSENDKELFELFTKTCEKNRIVHHPYKIFEYLVTYPYEKDYDYSVLDNF